MQSTFSFSPALAAELASDANRVVDFLADTPDAAHSWAPGGDVLVVLCGSQVLEAAEAAAAAAVALNAPLLVTGGFGHASRFLYDNVRARHTSVALTSAVEAAARSPLARSAAERAGASLPRDSRAEADVLVDFLRESRASSSLPALLIERESANGGQNAEFARRLAAAEGLTSRRVLVFQDPTMARRARASFERWFDGASIAVGAVPGLPRLVVDHTSPPPHVAWEGGREAAAPWSVARYLDLLAGEIPRLRDDEKGYGPRGAGFIGHVDIPQPVLRAHARLLEAMARGRGEGRGEAVGRHLQPAAEAAASSRGV